MRAGVDTFTNPYKKPILHQHDDQKDPLGRVASASYISTNPVVLPPSLIQRLDRLTDYGSKDGLKLIKKLKPFLYDKNWEGLGYIESVGNVTEEDAIKKVIDGRYHTISVGYGTDNLWCSECGTDWLAEGKCEHEKGQDYGNGPMFLMFGDLGYDEWSYVNTPADDIAMNEEFKHVAIPVAYADSKADKKLAMALAASDSMTINDSSRIAMTNTSLYVYDTDSDTLVPQNSENTNQTPGETGMKLQEIKDLGKDLYLKVNELIENEDARLSDEQIEALQDGDFVGANRLFPAVSKEYIDAAKEVLSDVNNSKEKTELIDFLNERASKFEDSTEEVVEEEKVETPEETTDDNTDSNDAEKVETTDFIEYGFVLKGEGWGIPDPDSANTEHEKAILELLLNMYAGKKEDAMEVIGNILTNLGEDKDSVIEELAKDTVEEFEGRIDNYKNEITVLKDSETAMSKTNEDLTAELKDTLADRIVSFKKTENPEVTKDELKDSFKSQSLEALRATAQNFGILFDMNVENEVVSEEVDPSLKDADETPAVEEFKVTQEFIDDYQERVNNIYVEFSRTNALQAEDYLAKHTLKIKDMKDSLAKEKNVEETSKENTEE